MTRQWILLFCACPAILAGLTASALAMTYVVKKGDVLSEVIHNAIPGPVWGMHGSFVKVIAKNPWIKNVDKILPGQTIEIPQEQNSASVVPNTRANRAIAESAPEEPAFRRGASFALSPFYTMSGISAADVGSGASSTLATQFYAGLNMAYVQEWSPAFRSFISLSVAEASFAQPTDSSSSVTDSSKFLSGINVGASVDLSSRFNLEAKAGYQSQLFANAVSTQSVTIDTVSIPSVGGKLSYDLLHLDPFVLGVSGSVAFETPAQTNGYNVRLGEQYGGIIYLKQLGSAGRSSNFQVEMGYFTRTQNTSVTNQTETDLTVGLRFFFPVGRKEEEGRI